MPWFQRQVPLGPPAKITSWRKVAIGTWRSAGGPSIYLKSATAVDAVKPAAS